MPWHSTPQNAPAAGRVQGPIDKARQLAARARAVAARRQALRDEQHVVFRELADLASRILRRRRYGDGRLDHS